MLYILKQASFFCPCRKAILHEEMCLFHDNYVENLHVLHGLRLSFETVLNLVKLNPFVQKERSITSNILQHFPAKNYFFSCVKTHFHLFR